MNLTPKQQAKSDGYRPMTTAYKLPGEQWMLDNTLEDMRRANADIVFVGENQQSVEIWKK
jgi:hypothetical protein